VLEYGTVDKVPDASPESRDPKPQRF